MDFDATQEQWIDRFAMRLAQLNVGATPDQFIQRAHERWPTLGQMPPEEAADAEHAARPPSDAPSNE